MLFALLLAAHLLLLFLLLWLLALGGEGRLARRPQLLRRRYAHRGLHDPAAGVPENSLPAFRRAADAGFGAELDVHLTRDGRLAVVHDSDLSRACGVRAMVEDLDAAALSALRLFGAAERIPFLEEVLPLFAGRGPLLIELKTRRNNGRALAAALCAQLAGWPGTALIESFDPRALRALRRLRPDLLRGQLARDFLRRGGVNPVGGFFLGNLWGNCLSRPDFVAYCHADRRALAPRLCRRLYGIPQLRWTIDSPAALAEAEADGAAPIFEGFVPDRPTR